MSDERERMLAEALVNFTPQPPDPANNDVAKELSTIPGIADRVIDLSYRFQ